MDKAIADFESFAANTDANKATRARQANLAEAEKYAKQTEEIQAEAKKLDQEADKEGHKGNRFDLGEVFLDVGLVVTSITLLSGKRAFWYAGMALGVIGIVMACTSVLVR
jgi:hypothetical protein